MNVGQFFAMFLLCAGVLGIGAIVALAAWFAGDFVVLVDGLKVMALAWIGSVVALLIWLVTTARGDKRDED